MKPRLSLPNQLKHVALLLLFFKLSTSALQDVKMVNLTWYFPIYRLPFLQLHLRRKLLKQDV